MPTAAITWYGVSLHQASAAAGRRLQRRQQGLRRNSPDCARCRGSSCGRAGISSSAPCVFGPSTPSIERGRHSRRSREEPLDRGEARLLIVIAGVFRTGTR